jgi:hypothetical protein
VCRVLGLFVDVEAVRTMMSRVDGVRVASTAAHDPAGTPSTLRVPPFSTRHRRFAGMGKVPNYFKSAQKELLSLGGKLIDKMKDYDKDNIPTKVRDSALKFPSISQLEVWEDGVSTISRRRDAVFMMIRASTRLGSARRRFRDAVAPRRSSTRSALISTWRLLLPRKSRKPRRPARPCACG